ncbi:hypothetical protein I4U23_006337 [Adineta vaga]|nr:hypothetical protein I4U23_006337 [Adineta vaga]
MQPINERFILITILAIMGFATLFCLLGIATPGWNGYNVFSYPLVSPAALCVISFLLLIGTVVLGAIILMGVVQNVHLPLLFVGLLIITSIFLLGAFTSANYNAANYAYNLVITSFTFTYLSSIIATYWLFGARQGTLNIGGQTVQSSDPTSPPKLQMS